jgi:lipopolysaccharide/colanic/teichoic acid biosynthesis glycosyltransferase
VLALLLCGWSVIVTVGAAESSMLERFIFAVGSAGAGYSILASLGSFRRFGLLPRWSDSISVVCAIPLGAGIGRLVTPSLDQQLFGHSAGFLVAGLCLAPLVFGGHLALAARAVSHGQRRRVVLAVSDEERREIVQSYFSHVDRQYVEFLRLADLRTELNEDGRPRVDLILISPQAVRTFDAEGVLLRAHLAGVPIWDHRRALTELTGRIRLEQTDLWTYLLEATPQTPLLRVFAALKVVTEPLLAVLLAILFLPLFVPLMALIPLTSRGPIFYRQRRIGYLGREFTLVKFRSMRTDAEAAGARWASAVDDRTTPFGRFLRRTRLDELPQLWNVMRGEMSFCGPRPERPEVYAALARAIPLFGLRTVVRPGITGWAQVWAGYAASVEESALKLEYDLYYIQNVSPRLDLVILLKTVWVAICGDAAAGGQSLKPGTGVEIQTSAVS